MDDKLENVVRECQRQISETGEALRSDVKSRVEAVSGGVARLEREVGHKAHSGDMKALSEEVAKLKKRSVVVFLTLRRRLPRSRMTRRRISRRLACRAKTRRSP